MDTKKSLFAMLSSAIIVVGVLLNTAAVNQFNLRGEGIASYDGKTEQFLQIAGWEQDDRDISVYAGDLPPFVPDSNSAELYSIDRSGHIAFEEAGLIDENGNFDFDKYSKLPTMDDDVSPTSVIGDDNRDLVTNTMEKPYRYIVYILSTYEGKNYRGTGFMISKNAVGTCAHNLYSKERGWASNVTVFAARDGDINPYGSAVKKKTYVSSEWISSGTQVSDWGLIELKTDLGSKTGYFGLRSYNKSVAGETAAVTGYPGTAQGVATRQMYTHEGSMQQEKDKRLFYEIDTSGGNSGSPIYVEGNYVIGIHAYGGSKINSGRRIDKTIFEFYKSFR